MRSKLFVAIVALLSVSLVATAQESSLNTYSPYTMYGLGNLNSTSGTTFVGMGGASIGFRNGDLDPGVLTRVNVSNPASLSGLGAKTFVFDVGLAGTNVYMRQRSEGELLRTSFNSFNVNNVTAAFSVAGKLGFAFNLSPYSEVGYRIHTDDISYLAELGTVRYDYYGQGDIAEAKFAVGWAPFKKLSIGAELIYLWGNIDRTYEATINAYTGSGKYGDLSSRSGGSKANTNEKVARIFGGFGVQYTPVEKLRSRLTIGATYRLGGKLNSEVTDFIPSNNIYGDTIRFNQVKSTTRIPQQIGVGVYFHKPKWAIGADWVYQDWGAKNSFADEGVEYVNTNTFKLGVQFTPQRYDIRGKFASFFNRITYRIGGRYGTNYLQFAGQPIREKAVTLGLDIPFRATNVSMLNVGLEFGQRGTMTSGLVKENYLKVNVGVMLFGRDYDYWFEKYKYN